MTEVARMKRRKSGRPPLSRKAKRVGRITVWANESEWRIIQANAKKSEKSVGEFLRDKGMEC